MNLKLNALCALFFIGCLCAQANEDPIVKDFAKLKIVSNDSKAEIIDYKGGKAFKFTLGHTKPWPNAGIKSKWDLSKYNYVKVDLTNLGDESVRLGCRVDNPGANGKKNNSGGKVTVGPGDTRTVTVYFNRQSPHNYEEILKGMHFYPDGTKYGAKLDPANVVCIQFFGFRPSRDQSFIATNFRAGGTFNKEEFEYKPEPFMPFVDEFGQYKHRDWPGKIHSKKEMSEAFKKEEADLKVNPAPKGTNKFGGWEDGPSLKATGHFRTEKYNGKWWLVDPLGKLFWSFGPTCVQDGGTSVVETRDGWFEKLPPETGHPESKFYVKKKSVRFSYKGKTLNSFDFGKANLMRKYGTDWENISADLAFRRLRSWGMNTLGCWSKGIVMDSPKMPYANWIYYQTPNIRAWGVTTKPFPDFFDPRFEEYLLKRAKNYAGRRNDDPYCIGFFIDNELSWGARSTVGRSVLRAPKNQPAKVALVNMLKEKYKTIDELNKVWKTKYKDWSVFDGQVKKVPEGALKDLGDYCRLTAEKYYSTCQKIMREAAPNKLYLGSRFAEVNDIVTEVANKYCDVVSFNLYRQSVAGWKPPAKLDKPVIIGEFHFGAKDVGVFGSGLVGVDNQQERAKALESYITGALENPLIVGAHWFQYRDEPTSGRPLDGENHQIGLVNICDIPYSTTIDAVRKVGYDMYKTRSGK